MGTTLKEFLELYKPEYIGEEEILNEKQKILDYLNSNEELKNDEMAKQKFLNLLQVIENLKKIQ